VDKNLQRRVRWFAAICIAVALSPDNASAAQNREAQISVVNHDVTLLGGDDTTTAASVGDKVPDGTAVRTGVDSRAELTFVDQTIARLGASTVLNFKEGARNLELSDGVMLLQVPKKGRGARIRAAGVAVAAGGSTVIFEYHADVYKFLILEGTARLYRPGHLGDSVLVRAGQMVIGKPSAALSDPVDFDVGRLIKTSRFIADFPPLRSEKWLAYASEKQQKAKSKKNLIDTNLVIFGGGTNVSLVKPTQPAVAANATTASVPPVRSTVPDSDDLGVIEIAGPSAEPAAVSANEPH
jgi:hypothetical protein